MNKGELESLLGDITDDHLPLRDKAIIQLADYISSLENRIQKLESKNNFHNTPLINPDDY